ncbi:MAG: hypothetical protein JWO67_3710 [Streptosporangiaceae bacterium]|nr:hypothetical protein [Streptosporangiaceae bacterium]
MSVDTVREAQAIHKVTDRLTETFADTYSAEHVEDKVATTRQRFDGHPIRDFVPILVERMVRRELETEAPATTDAQPETAADAQPDATAEAYQETTADAQPDTTAAYPETTGETQPDTGGDTSNSDSRHFPESSRLPSLRMPRVNGKGLVAALVAAVVVVVAAVVALNAGGGSPQPLTTVRGVVGSEKQAFFEDPRVRTALAVKRVKVDVDPAGSRQIATSMDLRRYDFAFPSSAPAADRIQRELHVSAKYTPFSSPMAIATYQPIADLLTKAGVAKHGAVWTFDVARYLSLAAKGVRWDQLRNNTAYPVRKNILVSTTDPRSSNSAAMYLAVAGYVANGDTIVRGAAAEKKVLPTVSRLFLDQGYTDNTTEGPFRDYLSVGMGKTPLVWIYEAQFVEAAARAQLKPGMVLMYPSPTVLSKHTLVPLDGAGDRIGRLLSTDPELQRLAAEHGFRSGDASQFAKVTADHNVPVTPDLIDVVDTPSYDTLEHLLNGVAKSYG